MADQEYPMIYWIEDGKTGAMRVESLEWFKHIMGDCPTFAAHLYRDETDTAIASVFIGSMNDPAYEMAVLYAQENT